MKEDAVIVDQEMFDRADDAKFIDAVVLAAITGLAEKSPDYLAPEEVARRAYLIGEAMLAARKARIAEEK